MEALGRFVRLADQLPSVHQGCAEDSPQCARGARRTMRRAALWAAARLWGVMPNSHVKTRLLAYLGSRFLVSVWAIVLDDAGTLVLRSLQRWEISLAKTDGAPVASLLQPGRDTHA